MATDNIVSVGDKVILSRVNKSGEKKEYVSRVVAWEDKASMKIEMPQENAMYVPLKIGREFLANFHTSANMYKCRVKIMERVKEKKAYFLIIKFLSELEKVQRREFYRLECVSDIDICSGIKNEEDKAIWEKAVMIDISGGGMKFNSNVVMPKDKLIKIRFPIVLNDEREFLICVAKIINARQMADLKYEYRVIFDNIENEVRERIIKHIFEEERRRRRNK